MSLILFLVLLLFGLDASETPLVIMGAKEPASAPASASAQGSYSFQTICQSAFADYNNLFCVSAYDEIGQMAFEFFVPISENSKIFAQTSQRGDPLVFYAEDVAMDIDCQSVKQSATPSQAMTDSGLRALFVSKCLWSNNGASRISVQNTNGPVAGAFAISYFPPVEDWYAAFLQNYAKEVTRGWRRI